MHNSECTVQLQCQKISCLNTQLPSLQEKDNANRIFEEVKAIKVFEYIQSVATLDQKDIAYNKFQELVETV